MLFLILFYLNFNSDHAILGMNVITECWRELMQGIHHGDSVFQATLPPAASSEWKKDFAICRRVEQVSLYVSPPWTM